jgi:ABC-type Fe3+ transport system permease subunit
VLPRAAWRRGSTADGITRFLDYSVLVPRAVPGLLAGLSFLWVFLFVPSQYWGEGVKLAAVLGPVGFYSTWAKQRARRLTKASMPPSGTAITARPVARIRPFQTACAKSGSSKMKR